MEFAIIVALCAGLTQIFKSFGFNDRFTPVFSILSGVVLAFLGLAGGVGEQIIQGLIAGLTAIGAYEVGKTSVAGK